MSHHDHRLVTGMSGANVHAEGTLSHDGRVVCPWHGACFNVKTGDIEDSPGLDSLYKWSAEVKGDKIVVTANQKELKSKVGRVVTSSKSKATAGGQSEETVVIVGGGSGGSHTVESLRMVGDLFSGPRIDMELTRPERVRWQDRPYLRRAIRTSRSNKAIQSTDR